MISEEGMRKKNEKVKNEKVKNLSVNFNLGAR
jgi:hypothetical protein